MSAQDYEKRSVGKDIHDAYNKAHSDKINGGQFKSLLHSPFLSLNIFKIQSLQVSEIHTFYENKLRQLLNK